MIAKRMLALMLAFLMVMGTLTAMAEAPSEPGKTEEASQATATTSGPYVGLIASLREAAQQVHISMPRALEAWLVSRAKATDSGLSVSIPMFDAAGKVSLPNYDGEEPAPYMQEVVKLLAGEIMLLPANESVGRIIVPNGAEADPALVSVLVSLVPDMEAWLDAQLSSAGAYSAMTRLVFDIPGSELAYWRTVSFADRSEAPKYNGASARRLLAQGDTGPTVRALQEELLTWGYLDADRASGTYTQQMEDAVRKFEIAQGFESDGQLSPEEQYVLLGQMAPFYLPQELAKQWKLAAPVEDWWLYFVYKLRFVEWYGTTVTLGYSDFTPIVFEMIGATSVFYADGEIPLENLSQSLVLLIDALEEMKPLETQVASVSLSLDALRSTGGASLVSAEGAETLLGVYEAYYVPVEYSLQMVEESIEDGSVWEYKTPE